MSRRARGWLIASAGLLFAAGLVAHGIWSRGTAVDAMQKTADQAAIPAVQITQPAQGPATQTLILPGNISSWNDAPIYAQVSGYVTHWYADYGAHVAAGQLLAEISAPGLDAQYAASKAQLDSAVAQYQLAQVTAQRYLQLKGSPSISQQQLDDKTAAADSARAQVAAAEQNVAHYQALINFEKVVAPFAGVVTSRRVSVGDYVNSAGASGTSTGAAFPLFVVSDISKLRVFIAVPQDMGSVLQSGIRATLSLPGAPGKTIDVDFLTAAGATEPSTRTIVTEFTVAGGEAGLLPGSYVSIAITTPAPQALLTVPTQALLFRSEGMQVAVLNDGEHVHLKDVTVGKNLGLQTQVLSGLAVTDKIIANPSLGLLEGQQVQVVQPAPGYGKPKS